MSLSPLRLLDEVIRPALLAPYLPLTFDTRDARALLLAWALQVEGTTKGTGPWHFDRLAVLGVTQNPAVDDAAAEACRDARIRCAGTDIVRRLDADRLLACRIARLALATIDEPLPDASLAGEEEAWVRYLRVTRAQLDPFSEEYAEARARWSSSWAAALKALG